jgi:outer membrane lipoprotein LolB
MKRKFLAQNIILITTIFLAACSTLKPQETLHYLDWQNRQIQLRQIHSWELNGALSINYRNKSNLASFTWQQNLQNYFITLHGPLNLGSACIVGSAKGVYLQHHGNQIVSAHTPEELIYKQFGWSLPISNLQYWVFALPAPGQVKSQQFDAYNHLIKLQQQDWTIEYLNFCNINGIDLPQTIKMKHANGIINIKFVLKTWKLS